MNTEIASTNVEYGGIIPDHRKIRLNLSKKWNSLELWKTVYHSLFSDVARIGVVFCWNSNPFYTCRALFQFLSQCCCVGIHSRQSVATMHLRLLFLFTNSIDPLIQLPFFFDFVHDYPHPIDHSNIKTGLLLHTTFHSFSLLEQTLAIFWAFRLPL